MSTLISYVFWLAFNVQWQTFLKMLILRNIVVAWIYITIVIVDPTSNDYSEWMHRYALLCFPK